MHGTRPRKDKLAGINTMSMKPKSVEAGMMTEDTATVAAKGIEATVSNLKDGMTKAAAGFTETQAKVKEGVEKAMKTAEELMSFSQGNLEEAKKLGLHNLALLANDDAPIIFLEPSCYSMFAEDYRELKLPGAEAVAARSFLFEEFLEDLLKREPSALAFDFETENLAVHTHCHAKALSDPNLTVQLASRLPNRTVKKLETGCCGMAGAFGMIASKYELSMKIAEPLIQQIKLQPYGTTVILSGTSCRHQVQHLATVRTKHIAEVMADALA